MHLHCFTTLFKVCVCNIIVLLLYILSHAHHQKFSFCPKITQLSHLPISAFYSCPLLTLCSYYSVLYKSTCLFLFSSVCSFTFVCFLCSTYELNHMVSVFLWLISLSLIPSIPSSPIHGVTNGKISSFVWLSSISYIYIYLYTPHLLYPFTPWWSLRLFPYLGYCK